MRKRRHRFEGRHVSIVWRDPDHDWNNFYVLEVRRESMLLAGEEQDGVPHDGRPFWANMREARSIKVRRKV